MPNDTPQMIGALNSPDPAERSNAAEQLARLGPEARAAAVALVRACADEAEPVREWAVSALEELGPPSVSDLKELTFLLRDDNVDLAYWAATLLGRLGEEAAADDDPRLARISRRAIDQIGGSRSQADCLLAQITYLVPTFRAIRRLPRNPAGHLSILPAPFPLRRT